MIEREINEQPSRDSITLSCRFAQQHRRLNLVLRNTEQPILGHEREDALRRGKAIVRAPSQVLQGQRRVCMGVP